MVDRVPAGPLRLASPTVARGAGLLELRSAIDEGPVLRATQLAPPWLLDRVEPRIEPFVPIALLLAGSAGRDLHLEGPVDPAYLTELRLTYIPLLGRLFGWRDTLVRVMGGGGGRARRGSGGHSCTHAGGR